MKFFWSASLRSSYSGVLLGCFIFHKASGVLCKALLGDASVGSSSRGTSCNPIGHFTKLLYG